MPNGAFRGAHLQPLEQRKTEQHETRAQFADAVDIAVQPRPIHKLPNLIHIRSSPSPAVACLRGRRAGRKHLAFSPTSLHYQLVDVNSAL